MPNKRRIDMFERITKLALPLAASFFFLAGAASADPWNKKTYVTFPNNVELPGRVMLAPGTYTMKLVDSSSNRYIVQVSNREENKVYATFHTIPKYRDRPADDTIITFYETPGSAPRFIHTWYYPGDTIGREFTYGKERAAYIASLTGSKVPEQPVMASNETMTRTTQETTLREEPVEEPVVSEQNQAERIAGGGDQQPEPTPALTDADTPDEPAPAPLADEPAPAAAEQEAQPAASIPETLPSTAGQLPLIAISGLVLLGLGTFLRRS
jgi:hypothetical protein